MDKFSKIIRSGIMSQIHSKDTQKIRKLYDFANIYEWELQYGMTNYKQDKARKGSELFISNYELNLLKQACFAFV
jgi:G:T-mismatch repair DNA endonuclease (very short patch repair protein)